MSTPHVVSSSDVDLALEQADGERDQTSTIQAKGSSTAPVWMP